MQFLADICDVEVACPKFQEVTALGAAKLAAYGAGLISSLDSAGAASQARWTPLMAADERARLPRTAGARAVAAALAAVR